MSPTTSNAIGRALALAMVAAHLVRAALAPQATGTSAAHELGYVVGFAGLAVFAFRKQPTWGVTNPDLLASAHHFARAARLALGLILAVPMAWHMLDYSAGHKTGLALAWQAVQSVAAFLIGSAVVQVPDRR